MKFRTNLLSLAILAVLNTISVPAFANEEPVRENEIQHPNTFLTCIDPSEPTESFLARLDDPFLKGQKTITVNDFGSMPSLQKLNIISIEKGDNDPVAYIITAEIPQTGSCYAFGGGVDRAHAKEVSCEKLNRYFLAEGSLKLEINNEVSYVPKRYRSTVGTYTYAAEGLSTKSGMTKKGLMMCDYDKKKLEELVKTLPKP